MSCNVLLVLEVSLETVARTTSGFSGKHVCRINDNVMLICNSLHRSCLYIIRVYTPLCNYGLYIIRVVKSVLMG